MPGLGSKIFLLITIIFLLLSFNNYFHSDANKNLYASKTLRDSDNNHRNVNYTIIMFPLSIKHTDQNMLLIVYLEFQGKLFLLYI